MNDLYRHFNKDGELLYVGISLSAVNRLSQHKSVSAWYHEIASVTIEKFDTRKLVIKAEKKAIKDESPLYNIIYNKEAKKLQNEHPKRIDDSKLYLLDHIVNVNPTYTFDSIVSILNFPKKDIIKFLEDGTLGSIIVRRKYLPQFKKTYLTRIVTGWQLLDFLEYINNGGLDE